MTWAIPLISVSHIKMLIWDVRDQAENLKYQAIMWVTISVSQDMRMLFSVVPTFHILSASQLHVRPRVMNSVPVSLCKSRTELQEDPWTEWLKDQVCGIPALQSLSFFSH